MREVEWEDSEGRLWLMEIPTNAPDSDAGFGIAVSPVDLAPLGLPLSMEVRLHNQLFHRGIRSAAEARARQQDIAAAIRTALRVDAHRIIDLYEGAESATPVRDA